MTKIKYIPDCVRKSDMKVITQAIPILMEYKNAGYKLTLRQLHYQFVARDLAPNKKTTYNKICEAMRRGRMAGLIDWNAIEDRTRILRSRPQWDNPEAIIQACANQFHVDYWQNQEKRVEVWIEKDALLGVIEETCNNWDCSYFSCRGYPSISELHETALRIKRFKEYGQGFTILYCGDHDPSGLDMGDYITRSLQEFNAEFEFKRIALSIQQIEQYNLPPNTIKESDTRSSDYQKHYGNQCWELDALLPRMLNFIIDLEIQCNINDREDFRLQREIEMEGRQQLYTVANNFDDALEYAETCA
ncbi:MAG: hypothetical protein LBC20_04010 [Planctomycetaceae bacterium]|jgi:hypothetical protein|nr:hypothetical protein [Planctomycetaceae bacterium]